MRSPLAVASLCLALASAIPSAAQVPVRTTATYRCELVVHPVVDFHHASLTLQTDGTFELHHTHTSPDNGWSTWLRGTYVRAPTELVLTPVSALRRVWRGDMHRQDHGEDVGAEQWEEPVSRALWHLSPTPDGGCYVIAELGTRVCAERPGAPTAACDAGRPPLRR